MLRTRSPRKEKISNCYLHSNSLSNKMDNSLLAVRDINHKYIVVKKEIDLLHEDAVVLDIASAPGGCDSAYCKEKHVPYKLALGLPGLYCPKTSAMILLEAMPFGYKPNREKWKS